MKKIVGILSAAAVLATSVFAADVSAGTKLSGKLFAFDADKNLNFFAQGNDSHDYANPNFVFSIGDDKAGATVKITTDGGTLNAAQTTQTIWFKPIDMLKFTLGNYDVALNKETIDYTESVTALGGNGYLVSLDIAGVMIDLGLNEGNNQAWWFSKADKADDPTIKPFFVKGGYSADFGTIGAYASFNHQRNSWESVSGGYGVDEPLSNAITNIDFGAGYKNTFNPVTMFVNVVGHLEKKFEWIRPEVFASGNVNAFGFAAFVAPLIYINGDLDKDAEIEAIVKLSYSIDGITPYIYFKDLNVLAKNFASTIKCGATGNLGAMGWNLWVQLDINTADMVDNKPVANKVAVSVPFELTINF